MPQELTVTRKLGDEETAENFSKSVGGTRINTTVSFRAAYSISKARYSVKNNKYVVYIRLYPIALESRKIISICVYADTSKEAYAQARKRVERGVYDAR